MSCSQHCNLSVSVNIGSSAFEALAQVVRRITHTVESKNDQHGRNSLLTAYIHYCCTLPPQDSHMQGRLLGGVRVLSPWWVEFIFRKQIDGLVQDCGNSSAAAVVMHWSYHSLALSVSMA